MEKIMQLVSDFVGQILMELEMRPSGAALLIALLFAAGFVGYAWRR